MLDSEHENPELIWNEDTRAKVARVIAEEANRLHQVEIDRYLDMNIW